MSLATWKKKFYPITAKQAAKKGALAACEHSLNKWQGAMPASLRKHGAHDAESEILQFGAVTRFVFDDTSCALCILSNNGECSICPIKEVRGSSCDTATDLERSRGKRSPFLTMAISGNPRPMITLLKKTLAYIKKQKDPK